MNDERRQARRYHWHSQDVASFTEAPHTAIEGMAHGEILNLTDVRAAASRSGQLALLTDMRPDAIAREHARMTAAPTRADKGVLQPCLPHLVMPAHHDVRESDVIAPRLHAALAAAAERGSEDFADLLLVPGVEARTVSALALVAEVVHGARRVGFKIRRGLPSRTAARTGIRSRCRSTSATRRYVSSNRRWAKRGSAR